MNRHIQSHSNMSKNAFSIVLTGLLLFILPADGMAAISEKIPKKHLVEQEEAGQILIEGEVTRVQGEFVGKDFSQMKDRRYLVRTPYGGEWNLYLEDQTLIIGDIFVGDYVQAKVEKDGSAHTVQKINQSSPDVSPKPVIRQITGIVEKKQGNFLYVKQGDHTEILHLDQQSTLEGDIREGSKIAAQLGEAGYAIKIQESQNTSKADSHVVPR